MITKTEEIYIHFELKAEAAETHKTDLDIIFKDRDDYSSVLLTDLAEEDSFHCNYSFTASYHGDLPACLSAVGRICKDPDAVVRVNCAALKKKRILVYETLKQLDALIQTVNGRTI